MMSIGAIEPHRTMGRWVCGVATAALLLSACWLVSHSLPERLHGIRIRERNEARVRDFCSTHGVERVVLWNGKAGRLLLFGDPAPCAEISYELGGWDGSHPARLAAVRQTLGEDIFHGTGRPGTYHYLMGPRPKHLALAGLLREHGFPHTRLETVLQNGPAVLYRVVSDDGPATAETRP